MTQIAPVDMWPVRCARCQKSVGSTNGNAGIEAAIYCLSCEPKFIKEADEMMAILDALTVVGRVTGKPREGNQCRGMPHAICHACGIGYKCADLDCPNDKPNPMFPPL